MVRDAELLALVHGDGERTHGERLPEEFDRALRAAHVLPSQLDLVAVASGPGAFTGLRIGLAAVQGLAMAAAIPAIGVSALDALAEAAGQAAQAEQTAIATWMDASRGEIFAAYYLRSQGAPNHWEAGGAPMVGRPEHVLQTMPRHVLAAAVFIGDGAARYRTELHAQTQGRAVVLEPPALAPFIARLALARAARGEAGPPHALQPLYVRRSDAELAREKSWT